MDEFKKDPYSDFILAEETAYIVLRSLKDINIFTDQAYIRISGNAAVGTKRNVVRLDWAKYEISSVRFETTGMSATDLDCELKFTIANTEVSIDIVKEREVDAIKIYRLLCSLCKVQQQNVRLKSFSSTLPQIHVTLPSGVEPGPTVTSTLTTWIEEALSRYDPVSYKGVFENYRAGAI